MEQTEAIKQSFELDLRMTETGILSNVEALKTILKEKITDKESYTVSTWRAYFNVISKIEAAVEKAEAAQFKLNAAMALQEESYTPKSWKPFNEARLALKALLLSLIHI